MIRTLMAASALAWTLGLAGAAQAATSPFSGETVFGDSLSDSGNLSIYTGLPSIMRFTTNPGLTTVEDVAAFYGLPLTPSLQGGTNFAYGGAGVTTNAPGTPAGVPTVTQQVTSYLAANSSLNSRELYTVFGGANDIFYHATAEAFGLESAATTYGNVTAAASQELTLIGDLQKAGARYIVVFNLPDIGRTPEAAADNALLPGTAAGLTTLSQGFNATLNAGLASTRIGIIPVNTYALLNEVLAAPSAYGFVNSTTPACNNPSGSSLNCTRATLVTPTAYTNYVFADGVHPTTYTHALFAQVVESEIIAPQQLSLLAEEPLATLEAERDAVGGQLLSDQVDPSTGVRLFATGGYVRQRFSGQAYTPSAHDDDGLITAGVDDRISADVSFGGELSGGTASEELNGQLRRFRTDSIMGSVFGQYVRGPAYVTGQGGLGVLHFDDVQRLFKIGPATRVENGDVDGQTYSVSGTAGYWLGRATLHAGPFVGLAYEHVHIDRYGEQGSDSTAMTFGQQDRESLIGEAGARVQGVIAVEGLQLRPFAELAYAYDGEARTRDVVAGLNTMNGEFAIPGFSPDRQWGEVQAGVEAQFTSRWSAYVAYDGRFAGASSGYDSGRIGVKYAF